MEEKKAEDKTEKKEVKEEKGEEKSHSESSHSTKSRVRKRLNLKKLVIALIVVIVIISLLILVLNFDILSPKSRSEVLTLSYNIEVGGESIVEETANFTSGFIASTFGFKTNKIDEEIKSMKVGEEKTITLEPEDGYGEYDETLIENIDRIQKTERKTEINRTTELTVERFKEIFLEEPVLNKEYELSGVTWKYKVIEVDEFNAKVQAQAKVSDKIPSGIVGIDRVVTLVTADKIVTMLQGETQSIPLEAGNLEIYFDNDFVYFKMNPYTDREITLGGFTGYVLDVTEDLIILDGNNPFAGKSITLKVKLVAKTISEVPSSKQKVPGAPTMQVFIMSYCPYGIQMLKGLLPVWKEFDDKANIELRFVSYTMHGQEEETENYRIICIREEQYSKLISYLECFSELDDPEGCMQQTGIDKTKAEDCMASRAASYFEEDKGLNELYGVQGSPTTILNEKEAEIYPRSPQDIANALCAAFTTKPSECSLTFSTANPSPGFGGGTSSSTTAASC